MVSTTFFSWFWREKIANFPESFKSVRWVGEVSKNFFTLKSSLTRYKKNYWKIPYLRNDNMLYSDRSYNWGRPSLPPEKKKDFSGQNLPFKSPSLPTAKWFQNKSSNKQTKWECICLLLQCSSSIHLLFNGLLMVYLTLTGLSSQKQKVGWMEWDGWNSEHTNSMSTDVQCS